MEQRKVSMSFTEKFFKVSNAFFLVLASNTRPAVFYRQKMDQTGEVGRDFEGLGRYPARVSEHTKQPNLQIIMPVHPPRAVVLATSEQSV